VSAQDGRPKWTYPIEVDSYYPVVLLAITGIVILSRRRVRLLPLTAQLAAAAVTAALAWGALRFRTPADVALVVLGGVALDAGLARVAIDLRYGLRRNLTPGR
jgi:hypothetical protein